MTGASIPYSSFWNKSRKQTSRCSLARAELKGKISTCDPLASAFYCSQGCCWLPLLQTLQALLLHSVIYHCAHLVFTCMGLFFPRYRTFCCETSINSSLLSSPDCQSPSEKQHNHVVYQSVHQAHNI